MNQILFSIIIPLYNKSKWINDTINCVLNQTEKNFEIIVVDDGSTDGSEQIVKRIKDDRVHLYIQKNQGVSAARNKGIELAKGKYISFLDADDTWTNDYLLITKRLFDKYPNAKIACPMYKVRYNKKDVIPKWKIVSTDSDCIITDFLETAKSRFWLVNSSCITIERELLLNTKKLFPIGETVYEDFDLWIRLGINHSVAHSNKICSIYNRQTEDNARTSHHNKIVYSKSFMETLDNLEKSTVLTIKQKKDILEIKDRRMVPFIFSLILNKKNKQANEIIKNWKPKNKYKKYRFFLKIANYMPSGLIFLIQDIRNKIF